MSEGVPVRPRALEMIAARQQPLSGAQGYFAVRFGQIMNFRVAAAEMSSRAGMKMIYTVEFIHLTDIHRIIHFFCCFVFAPASAPYHAALARQRSQITILCFAAHEWASANEHAEGRN